MNRYAAELFATFCLVFAGTGAVVINDVSGGEITHVGIALTFGLVVMAMIYAVGDVSGAHMNPAVTLGFWAARRFPGSEVPRYIAAQCAGALLASGLLKFLFTDHPNLGATLPRTNGIDSPEMVTFVLEVVLTLMLMFVILCVSTGGKEKGMMAGVAIGGVIALEAMFAGPITGASMNPARSLGPAVVSGQMQSLWIYLIAPVVGALLAVPFCRCAQHGTCCSAEDGNGPEEA